MAELTINQTRLLEQLDALHLLGASGARHVKSVLTSSDFDPASAASDSQADEQALREVENKLRQAASALKEIDLDFQSVTSQVGKGFALVVFKDQASISNIADFKKWANDWYEIGRGLAVCSGDRPEDIRVEGAQNGSIILYLSMGVLATSLLARMTKHLASIAKEIIQVQLARDSLDRQRLLTQTIRDDLDKQREKIEKEGVSNVFEEAKKLLGDQLKPEQEAVLKKAVTKFSAFYTAGGEVELISNFSDTDAQASDSASVPIEISDLNSEIAELRELREEIRLLGNISQIDD